MDGNHKLPLKHTLCHWFFVLTLQNYNPNELGD